MRCSGRRTRVFSGKTDALGQVLVPAAYLVALPGGSYDVDAFFNGVNLPGAVVTTSTTALRTRTAP